MNPIMHARLSRILRAPYVGKGASEETLNRMMEVVGYRLPEDYLEFMRETNGYNGEVGPLGYVCIWPVEEIAETNMANHFREWVPGLVLFGSNEGGEYFAFDMRNSPPNVVKVPGIPLTMEHAVSAGETFVAFLERLALSTEDDNK